MVLLLFEVVFPWASTTFGLSGNARSRLEDECTSSLRMTDGEDAPVLHEIGSGYADRITLHVALELQRRGSGYGVAALCGGGGQSGFIGAKPMARPSGGH